MDTISHKKAQLYLHLRREGLETDQRKVLEEHLFLCKDCRSYARNLERLEMDLSRNFHNRLDLVPTPTSLAVKVTAGLYRGHLYRKIFSLGGSLAGALTLVILVFVLFKSFPISLLPATTLTPVPSSTDGVQQFGRESDDMLASPSTITGGRLIAFTSQRDGNEEIYVMNTEGGNPKNLTSHPAADYLPTWSPDGQRLAFISDRFGKPEVYVMYYDGSGVRQLTDLPEAQGFWSLSWSPDSERLAAEALWADPESSELNERIFLIRADGSGVQDLTQNKLPKRAYDPQWAPVGDLIAYRDAGLAPVFMSLIQLDMRMDVLKVFPFGDIRYTPAFAWSPDGSRLAYFTTPWPRDEVPPEYFDICRDCQFYDDEPGDLRLSSLDGSKTRTLYRFEDLSMDFYGLSWSPNGGYLAFTANEGEQGIRHLYLLGVDDQVLLDVAGFGNRDRGKSVPSWSPDGTRLVFDTGREGIRDIFIVNLEARLGGGVGSGIINLTSDSHGMDYQPQWQP